MYEVGKNEERIYEEEEGKKNYGESYKRRIYESILLC